MKQLALAIAVLAALCLAAPSPAVAGKPKPAKNICLDFSSSSDTQVLFVKSVGTVKTAAGKITFFSIVGSAATAPSFAVAGAGHMEGPVFHASYQGNVQSQGASAFELFFNVTTGTGTIHFHYDTDGDTVIFGTDSVTAVACTTLIIPGAT